MRGVIENGAKRRHLRHRIISLMAVLATLGLVGLLLAMIAPAISHAARSFEVKPEKIETQAVAPDAAKTVVEMPSTTTTLTLTPQQYQAVVLYDTFVSVYRDPVGPERPNVSSLKSKTLVFICDAASDSVTLRYQVALDPCGTAKAVGWMNGNTLSPPIPLWPEARVTRFPTPTLGPQPTSTPTETPTVTSTPTEMPTPTPTVTPVPSPGGVLQNGKAFLIGGIAIALIGLGYLLWKIISAPMNTEIYVSRPAVPSAKSNGGSRSPTPPIGTPPANLADIRRLITERLDVEDIRTLCFDLGVDYDRLRGEGKGGKARELVALLHRQERLPELLSEIQRLIAEGASGVLTGKHDAPTPASSGTEDSRT